jgi:DNA invertase Pin-like site-specific DNA recombinase
MPEVYGYIRVSTREQNEDRQLIALESLSIPAKIYTWISSRGKTSSDHNIRS